MSEETLPEGWTWAGLGELARNRDNQRVPVNAKERAERSGNVPYYGAAGPVGWIDEAIYDEDLLLVGEDGIQFFDPYKPKAYLVSGPAWVNNHAHVLSRLSGGSDLRYLKYYLDQFDYQGYANGTTRLKLTRSAMDRIPVAIAPLNEQRRIVDELERRLSHVDAAEAGLKRALGRLEVAKLAVLKAAFNGSLAPPTRDSQGLIAALVGEADAESVAEHGFYWLRLEDVARWSSGGTPKAGTKEYYGGAIPWAVIGDLSDRVVFETASTITQDGLDNSSAKIVPAGTLLVAMYGSIGKLGVAGVDMATNQAIATGQMKPGINVKYVFWWLRLQRSELIAAGMGGTQSNISQTILKPWPVPIVAAEDQDAIVDAIEARMQRIGYVEGLISAQIHSTQVLRRSLLATAFSGKLVPQDPDDEPAAELLARIRAEREAAAPVKRTRKATARKAASKKEVPA